MRVAVIGAGPSGLVTLKYLLAAEDALDTEHIEARLFESEPSIGGTFYARTYEDAELVSSRQLTTFSDFRLVREPDFLSAKRYIKYLHDYCTHFKLWSFINLSSRVTSLQSRLGGGHVLRYVSKAGSSQEWECDAVAVCSGLHVLPNLPHINGIESIPERIHSSQFKRREQFGVDKTVLILGSGETASDIGHLAVTSPTKQVILCHRNGFHLAPKTNPVPGIIGTRPWTSADPPKIPIDVSRASLFDTAYVHPWLRKSMWLWTYYDYYVGLILWLSWGTTHGQDQWIGGKPPGWSTSQIFFNKSSKIGPYINNSWRPARPTTWLLWFRSLLINTPSIDTQGRRVDLAPWPDRIEDGKVVFRDNGRPEYLRIKEQEIKPDIVVYCTGYKREFPFLDTKHFNADVRDIWNKDDPSIGFIGFIRPSLGAMPPIAEMQARLWVLHLLAPERVHKLDPDDEPHYRLITPKDARIRFGVDHESYVYQLALDMNTAPSFGEVLRLSCRGPLHQMWRMPLVWALGANFNTKFRLVGPWNWEGASAIMIDELWETITRRPLFFGHFTLSAVPMIIFGPFSFIVYICSLFMSLFGDLE